MTETFGWLVVGGDGATKEKILNLSIFLASEYIRSLLITYVHVCQVAIIHQHTRITRIYVHRKLSEETLVVDRGK